MDIDVTPVSMVAGPFDGVFEAPVEESAVADVAIGRREPIGVGVIGLGSFGRFCLEAYLTMPGIAIVAIADMNPDALTRGMQLAPHAVPCDDAALLIAMPEVEVVTICATPDRHPALVLAAILAGKHVVCDKPLGVSLAEFDTVVTTASARGVALGINLVLRHHPLYVALHNLCASGVLGAPRRLAVENYADEGIGFGPAHWFWNRAHSGGLALAADVHWFDLATRLLGPARAVQAWDVGCDDGIAPRRLVTTAHGGGAVATIYHAFDTRPDATSCTVLMAFDEGEARIEGWIPTRLTVACPTDRAAAAATLLGATQLPHVSMGDDNRAVLVLSGGPDRRGDYQEMIRTTLRLVLDQAEGRSDRNDLAAARSATATALAAEFAVDSRDRIVISAGGSLEATG